MPIQLAHINFNKLVIPYCTQIHNIAIDNLRFTVLRGNKGREDLEKLEKKCFDTFTVVVSSKEYAHALAFFNKPTVVNMSAAIAKFGLIQTGKTVTDSTNDTTVKAANLISPNTRPR
jgi:hypothetical protein